MNGLKARSLDKLGEDQSSICICLQLPLQRTGPIPRFPLVYLDPEDHSDSI